MSHKNCSFLMTVHCTWTLMIVSGLHIFTPSAWAETASSNDEELTELRILNCISTATPDYVDWGHRYTYWLSGVAQFNDSGEMLPIANEHAADWTLTLTNSRFDDIDRHLVLPLGETEDIPAFTFPAVSLQEWQSFGQRPINHVATVLSDQQANHGLYLGIRNTTTGNDTSRQLFQVIHYLSNEYAMHSTVSSCFVGPRPILVSEPLGGDRPSRLLPTSADERPSFEDVTSDVNQSVP